ncbi:hypothetical protein KAR48_00285 [bacterium]|nr:hypothetical protein [bacterium]
MFLSVSPLKSLDPDSIPAWSLAILHPHYNKSNSFCLFPDFLSTMTDISDGEICN